MPLDVAGFALLRSLISAIRLSLSCAASNFDLPMMQWMIPALSTRYVTWPALAFFTAVATSGVTVPTFGFGMSPRGPRIWPSWPTTRIASGLAITRSKLMLPAFTCAARSSMPTMSAPAAFASSTFLPAVNTATRSVLPVPCGITVEPRTCWSDFAASMPRFTAASTVSLNLAVANSFTSFRASSIEYCLPGVSLDFQVFSRFVSAMCLLHHVHAHRTGGACNRAYSGVEIGRREIRRLRLRDLFELFARDLADLRGVGRAAAFFDADRLANQHRRRRRLHDEREAAIRVHGDDHRDRQVLFDLLRGSVELLAEFHDVHALLTERGPDRRRRIGGARRHLQLDVAVYLLSHDSSSWVRTP